MRTAGIFFALTLLFSPSLAAAQLGVGENALNLILNPERPRAESRVEIELESFTVDLNSSRISWFLNKKSEREGVGEKHLVVTLGPLGTVTTISVVVETIDGRKLTGETVIRPANVDLLSEASGYTPPFYRGKSLMPFEGTLFVAALPAFVDGSNARLSPSQLIYTWRENGTVIGDSSGVGRSLFVVASRIPIRPKTVSVEVAAPDGTLFAAAQTEIAPVEPRLLLYEDHPLYGIQFHRALRGAIPLQKDEMRVVSVPFYFEAPKRDSSRISYVWSLNFKPLSGERKPTIVLRRTSAEGGKASLSAEAQYDETKPFQAARAGVELLMERREIEAKTNEVQ